MIGYYVHHHGLGHLARARQICDQLARRGHEVVGFSSLARPQQWPGDWVDLPLDTVGADATDALLDQTAGGVLHWAPLGHDGLRERMSRIAGRLGALDLMVVDVSVEVALLARLFGVPTVVVAMRGLRDDRPHAAAYDAATTLLAPWSPEFPEPWWPQEWTAKTTFVGAMSRFDHLSPRPRASAAPSPAPSAVSGTRRVLAVWGGGGSDLPADAVASARLATPGWQWVWRSPAEPSPDLWHDLADCDVVVCHAGNNTVAEVAAARRPAIVLPQSRPFQEQHHTADALARAGLAVTLDHWPEPERWPRLLEEAARLDGSGWSRWNRGDGAALAADALAAHAVADDPADHVLDDPAPNRQSRGAHHAQ